jgi:VanZ family protein
MHFDAGDRLKLRRWLPPLLWAGVIIFATSMPSEIVPQQVSKFDKTAHFGMYAILGALVARHLAETTSPWRAALVALAITAAFGAVDEWHQQFISGRSTELADWRADSLGAATGAFLIALVRRRAARSSTDR